MANNSMTRMVWQVSLPIIMVEATETLDHLIDTLFLARVGITELGAIAVRVAGKLEWDAANLRFKNSDAANDLVKPIFRKGWEISLT